MTLNYNECDQTFVETTLDYNECDQTFVETTLDYNECNKHLWKCPSIGSECCALLPNDGLRKRNVVEDNVAAPVGLLALLLKQLAIIIHHFCLDFGLHHASNGHALTDAMANVGAVEGIEWGVGEGHMGRKCGGVDDVMGARIHHDRVAAQNVFVVIPMRERQPVVGAHDECEIFFGIGFRQFTQRSVGVGWFGQVEFEIRDDKPGFVFERKACEF